MADLDKPDLGLYVWEEIEAELHEVDKSYWQELREMQVSVFADTAFIGLRNPPPPPPRRPIHLLTILGGYARALFYVEASKYPQDPRLKHWLEKLTERTRRRVMDALARLEMGDPINTLRYHNVPAPQMTETVDKVLRHEVEKLFPTEQSIQATVREGKTVKKAIKRSARIASATSALPNKEPEIERRRNLLAEYKAAAGDPSDYRIYNAKNSGIHKPQFYQWRNGVLPRGSKTACHFEQFLRDKKPPTPKN
jgi:hypothetical protein